MNDPRQLLHAHGLRPKKSFGQNFLVNAHHVASIAEACLRISREAPPTVIELGAGTGVLTAALLARGAHVVAVERDRELLPVLNAALADPIANGALQLIEADAQRIDVPALLQERGRQRAVLAGNLPYQITGALLELATRIAQSLEGAVFMVQKEVADRLLAAPRSKDYSALTVFVSAQFVPERVVQVPRTAFHPVPDVDSTVVALVPRSAPIAETAEFRAVVKAAFSQRRKKLRNAWGKLADGARLQQAAEAAGISLDARGEELEPARFAAMAMALGAP